jgi:hypothetical protein
VDDAEPSAVPDDDVAVNDDATADDDAVAITTKN